jgi:hypothetical protein
VASKSHDHGLPDPYKSRGQSHRCSHFRIRGARSDATQNVKVGPRQTARYSVGDLVRSAGLRGTFGGITVFAPAHAGALDTVHFTYDYDAEFSALLKMFDHDPNVKLDDRDFSRNGTWTLRAPMLALSDPDPALA